MQVKASLKIKKKEEEDKEKQELEVAESFWRLKNWYSYHPLSDNSKVNIEEATKRDFIIISGPSDLRS